MLHNKVRLHSVFLVCLRAAVYNSWDRNTYQWQLGTVDVAPITMDRNLFVCNYRAFFPIDNDDGSNGYIQTNNFLLWGGTKTLMGYNKHFIVGTLYASLFCICSRIRISHLTLLC
jgi:hypothetical protein